MRELIRYLICGLLTTVVSLSSYYAASMILGTNSTIHLQACNVISWALAVVFSFFVSRAWVFQSKSKHVWNEFFAFVGGRISPCYAIWQSCRFWYSGCKSQICTPN